MAADQSAVAALVLSCQSAMDGYHSAEGGDGSKGNAKGGDGSKGSGKGNAKGGNGSKGKGKAKGKGKDKGKVKAKGQGKVAKGNGKNKDGSYKAGTYALASMVPQWVPDFDGAPFDVVTCFWIWRSVSGTPDASQGAHMDRRSCTPRLPRT